MIAKRTTICRVLQAIKNNEFKEEIKLYQIQTHVPDLLSREASVGISVAEQDEDPRAFVLGVLKFKHFLAG